MEEGFQRAVVHLSYRQTATDAPRNPSAHGEPKFSRIATTDVDTGSRRAPGSRFVPPVRREEGEGGGGGGGSSCLDGIRNRVQYGGSSGSGDGGGGSLPPELEGDERLKNIEPRMVELIMNEVLGSYLSSSSFLPSHIPHTVCVCVCVIR